MWAGATGVAGFSIYGYNKYYGVGKKGAEFSEISQRAKKMQKIGEFTKAAKLYEEAYELVKGENDAIMLQVWVLAELSSIHLSQGNVNESETLLGKANKLISTSANDNSFDKENVLARNTLCTCNNSHGDLARQHGDYEKSLEYYLNALKSLCSPREVDICVSVFENKDSGLDPVSMNQNKNTVQELKSKGNLLISNLVGVLYNCSILFLQKQEYNNAQRVLLRAIAVTNVCLGESEKDMKNEFMGSLEELSKTIENHRSRSKKEKKKE